MPIGIAITDAVTAFANRLAGFIPQFIAGLVILIIGLVVATILRELIIRLFRFLNLGSFLGRFEGLVEGAKVEKGRAPMWSDILGELVRWAVIILFLVPAVEAWGLPRVTEVLNQVLFYLPNVFVAVVVGFVGLGIANVVYEVVRGATREFGSGSANLLASVARYAIVFFTALVVLNELGIAADLVRILFTGIVGMLALAGGIAFGLGGQESARRTLAELRLKLEEKGPAMSQVNVRAQGPARKTARRRR